MPTVPELRASLSDFHKELLDEIVEAFLPARQGVVARALHLKYKNKLKVVAALKELGGSVVVEVEDWNSGHRYQPTFLGILLSSQGERFEQVLSDYVVWLEQAVQISPAKISVTSQEVMAGMGLTLDAVAELYRLIGIAGLFGRSCSGDGPDKHWGAGVFEEIDDLDAWPNRKDYVRHLALKGYELGKAVLLADRKAPHLQSLDMPLFAERPVKKADVDIFLSHSSKDRDLAEALITLLQKALRLNADRIRCTSVPGFRLSLGADTDEQIRAEVLDSRVLIGLLTPTSLSSSYVLFELGARWGRNLFLAPLLAKGASAGFLRGPISGFNALPADQEKDLQQFLRDVAKELSVTVAEASVYGWELQEVARISRAGDLFNHFEGRRVKGRGERKRDQYFVSQGKTHYLNQEAATVCDQAKIDLVEIDPADEAWLLQSTGVDLNAAQMEIELKALKLWTPPLAAVAVISRRRRNLDKLI